MQPQAILGGALGALAGALIWAGLSALTGYEIGYVAWGVGLLVGVGARLLGGRGQATGVACAVLALASIFAGKVLSVRIAAPAQIRKSLEPHFSQENYREFQRDATDFAGLESPDRHAEFMVAHGFTEAEEAAAVPPGELAEFRRDWAPRLAEFHAKKPDYEAWRRDRIEAAAAAVMADLDLVQAVRENLNLVDLVFAFLGITTAFKLGGGAEEVRSRRPPAA